MDKYSKSTVSKSGFVHVMCCLSAQKSDSQMEMSWFISLNFELLGSSADRLVKESR